MRIFVRELLENAPLDLETGLVSRKVRTTFLLKKFSLLSSFISLCFGVSLEKKIFESGMASTIQVDDNIRKLGLLCVLLLLLMLWSLCFLSFFI